MVSVNLIKRALHIGKIEGWVSVWWKTYRYFLSKIVTYLARKFFVVNSQEYWNFRMKYDWSAVGGGGQTQIFAASLFANVPKLTEEKIDTVLDYGCATGDSSLIIRLFFPAAKIYLYDLSEIGLSQAIGKYKRFIDVAPWNNDQKVDLVYCSNVIEHVDDPKLLVNALIEASNRFVVIQCPWRELHSTGDKLSIENPSHEHIWTIDEEFFEKYIKDDRVEWSLTTGIVPMAWEGGVQAYFLGIRNNSKLSNGQ